jgi:recombination protein RecR
MTVPLFPAPLSRLIRVLGELPTIGPKTAQRLAYFLSRATPSLRTELAEAILALNRSLVRCAQCQTIAENSPCRICADTQRDSKLICVVAEPSDVAALERTKIFRGHYHILGGLLSPLSGVKEKHLTISALLARVKKVKPREVILALNPSTEGEATVLLLRKRLAGLVPRLTRLAVGIPTGGELEYADELTLARALEGRTPVASSRMPDSGGQ